MMDGDDIFLLSFADALTCVFGAAIALFLIFVVLVKLDPVEPGKADVIEELPANSTDFDDFLSQGSGDVIVHIQASSCKDIQHIFMNAARNAWLVSNPTRQGTAECARIFEVPRGNINSGTEISTTRIIKTPLKIRVIAGATIWPASSVLHFPDPLNCVVTGIIGSIQADNEEPLRLNGCGR
ncbi:hypothetical protein [Roseibium sp. RKSG952]|uniref:hypothetical protein n=1 Tax=Roseibium sp. RKSG952 TaxID=2529384 RepID=UPI0012BC025F|nr:hypothetical protein [Roseibium sp. RKSG952]MTH95881.1 hypothetical protein [Roseibium sp. RKSG952]